MDTERQLIKKAKAGSTTAFTALIQSYQDRLLRFLVTRCASRADAEDALQETMLNAFRYLHSYDSKWRFSTWLYRIALRNGLRTRRVDFSSLDDVKEPSIDPHPLLESRDDRRNLWGHARRVLSEEVYTAMWLRYVEGMSHREIAQALQRSVAWTKVNLLRARSALSAEFQSGGNRSYG